VIIPDVNLLIYAIDEVSPHRPIARAWLGDIMSGSETVGFPWHSLLGFLRLTTNPRLLETPLSPATALDIIDGWLAQPNATIAHPTRRHAAVLRDLLTPVGVAGDLTPDAHLAALAIEHGATLHSADTDFARFAGLRWYNPLA
jgi:toxin-antitoxin system PIN domain toxin